MSAEKSLVRGGWRRRLILWGIFAAIAAGLWFGSGPMLGFGISRVLPALAERAGFELKLASARVRFGEPITLGGVSFRGPRRSGPKYSASAKRVAISLENPLWWFGSGARPLREIEISGARFEADARSGGMPPERAKMRRASASEKKASAERWLVFLPRKIVMDGLSAAVFWEGGQASVSGVAATFDEGSGGELRAAGMEVQTGRLRQVFAAQRAVTAWKNGSAYLADMQLRNGMRLDNLAIQLLRPGGPALDFDAAVFGGLARGGISTGEWRGEPGIDAALWASGLDLGSLAEFAGVAGPVAGSLREGKLTFRGNPERALDAEGALRVSADGFRWGKRGWQSLEASASLINRRLILGGLELRQADNSVKAAGEVALSGSWADTVSSPFALKVSASIQDLRSLSALVGSPFDEMNGRMSLGASLSGRANKLDGFLSLEVSDAAFRGRPVDSAKLDAVFAGGEVRVERAEAWSRGDYLNGSGAVGLAAPYEYSGQLQARAANVGDYSGLFPEGNAARAALSSGAAQLRWQGDGNFRAHSGAFSASAEDAVTAWTPAGITVRASGTYSPGNMYFSGLEFERDKYLLSLRATVARSGVRVEGAGIRSGKRKLAEAEFFLPVDLFGGKPDGADPEIYAKVDTAGTIPIDELYGMLGLKAPVAGDLACDLDLSGSIGAPLLGGSLEIRNLRVAGERGSPGTQASLKFGGEPGRIAARGSLRAGDVPGGQISVSAPFSIERDAGGKALSFASRGGEVAGSLQLPLSDLRALRWIPWLRAVVCGNAGCSLALAGTAQEPLLEGTADFKGVKLVSRDPVPPIELAAGSVRFSGPSAEITWADGEVGTSKFGFWGNARWDGGRFVAEISAEGKNLPFWVSAEAIARGDASLVFRRSGRQGAVAGNLTLTSCELMKRLVVTPTTDVSAPAKKGQPPAKEDWEFDLGISGNATAAFRTGGLRGTLSPRLRVSGPVSAPRLDGEVEVSGAAADLPAGIPVFWDGRFLFGEPAPEGPSVELRGWAKAGDLSVDLSAAGPLAAPKLVFNSTPPYPASALVQLLNTGRLPPSSVGAKNGGAGALAEYFPPPRPLGSGAEGDAASRFFAAPEAPTAAALATPAATFRYGFR